LLAASDAFVNAAAALKCHPADFVDELREIAAAIIPNVNFGAAKVHRFREDLSAVIVIFISTPITGAPVAQQ
jgi:hypothetical protein